MKSIINPTFIRQNCLWLIVVAGFGLAGPVNAQPRVLGSIAKSNLSPQSAPTRVLVYGKPNIDLMNVLVENINICVSIPDLGMGNPEVTLSHAFIPSLEWMAVGGQPDIVNGRAYYTFIGNDTSAIPISLLASANNPIVELSFDNGAGWEYVQLNDLTDAGGIGSGGGPSGQSFWYVQLNTLGDVTNYDNKFYKNDGSKWPINGGANAPSSVETADTILLPVNPSPENAMWRLFPNPVAGPLHLVSGVSETVQLRIFDQLGQLMWEEKTMLTESELFTIHAVGSLPGGVYMLEISAPDGQRLHEERFIVRKE
ncbi:MAG TPA: hypothetical protein DCF33_22080 [Saprospirales bacterium]|nr:hypothetical protein [Saprospirales bacterium]